MTDNGFDITRRKILGAVGAVGVASAGAGLGTTAYFSDTESLDNNAVQAGELDLKIDWQQIYENGSAGPTSGKEYVNAFPDHDDDGLQSLEVDGQEKEYDGTNIQEYLDCQSLDAVTVPEDFQSDDYPDLQHLIDLEDVKPGDRGEVTFSFHLCDNPGYVYFTGELVEDLENGQNEAEQPDGDGESTDDDATGPGSGELAEEILVRAWYDLDCDNEFDDGTEDLLDPVFNWGTLREFLTELESDPVMLSPAAYSHSTDSITSNSDCLPLGKIEGWQQGKATDIIVADAKKDAPGTSTEYETSGQRIDILEPGDSGNVTGTLELYFLLENTDTGNQTVVRVSDIQDSDGNTAMSTDLSSIGEPIEFDFDTLPSYGGYSSDERGICYLDLKAGSESSPTGGGTERIEVRDEAFCSTGELNVDTLGDPLNGKGLSNVFFYYCPDTGDTPRCFPDQETFCVGFEWWLPKEVGNEVQSDTVAFDVGFYAEQCRHNESPDGPPTSN